MGDVVRLNNKEPKVEEPKQVYGCGDCEDQGHRLLEDGEIVCGHPECGTESAFLHYEPEVLRVGEAHGMMRLLKSRADNLDNYVCPKCRGNRFHLHPSGSITCFRCRHSVPFKWWHPGNEGEHV